MRFASIPMRCSVGALALWLSACTCGEPAPRSVPTPEVPEVPEVPEAPEPATETVLGSIPLGDLPPLVLSEDDQGRTNEALGLGGFSLGQTLEQARARCVEVGGELTHLTRAVHRCRFADRENQPRTHVDVSLLPGDEPGPVARIVFVYTSGAGEPLIPAFAGVTGTLFDRAGPPRSRSTREACAVATANLLARCLETELVPVEQLWRTLPTPIGDPERMQEAGVEGLRVALQPSGELWTLTVSHEATGYTEAFVAAYQDAESEGTRNP